MPFWKARREFCGVILLSKASLLPHQFRLVQFLLFTHRHWYGLQLTSLSSLWNSFVIVAQRIIFCGFLIAELKPTTLSVSALLRRHIQWRWKDEKQTPSIAIFSFLWEAIQKVEWYKSLYCFCRANILLRWRFSDELRNCMCDHALLRFLCRAACIGKTYQRTDQLEIFPIAFPWLCVVTYVQYFFKVC